MVKEILNKYKLNIIIYTLLFVVLFGVGNSKVYYTGLAPFGVALVFSLLLVKINGYGLSIIYLLANLFPFQSGLILGGNIIVSLTLAVLQFILNYKKTSIKKLHIYLMCGINYFIYIAINFSSGKENLALLVSVALGVIFLYCCLIFLDASINRRFISNLNLDEKIAGGVILMIFILGMSSVNIGYVNLGLLFVTLIILVGTYVCTSNVLLVISLLMGISYTATTLNLMYVSFFLVLAIVSLSFKCTYKVFSGIAIIGGYLITTILLELGFCLQDLLSVSLGSFVFVLIPSRILFDFSKYFDAKMQIIVRNILSSGKKQLVSRVDKLSKIFNDMTTVYRDMVRGGLSDEDAIKLLKEELISSVCDKCSNKDNCFRRSGSFVNHSIDALLSIGFAKGKVLLVDLPASLGSNCIRVNELMGVLNNLISSYKDYALAISNLDTSRVLIADQLYGVSKLLESLSKEVDININFDSTFENRIKEDLSYKNVICSECAIYESDSYSKMVNLIVKSETIDIKIIEKIISKILSVKMMVYDILDSEIKGLSVVSLCVRPNYDIVFGVSACNKYGNKVSGDNHSIIKIDEGKYMVSICDGMGSGKKANKISTLSINLIENFYKAGFENEIILNSVNKLLSLTEEENFSTVDLCVIDCKKNIYDFIKLGATDGYIKRQKGDVEVINSNSLPVGVLEEISPHITKALINPFDIVVIVSDGVADAFSNKLDLKNFIYNLDVINPQTLSDEILKKSLELSSNIPKDDMTVVCVRVFDWV